jgi:hypothetical protein
LSASTLSALDPILEKRVAAADDDIEERPSGGTSGNASDLELGYVGSRAQEVGIRFTGLDIPQGAQITAAYIQLTADETSSGDASLLIRGEDSDSAAPFTNVRYDVSSRPVTDTSVGWTPGAWTSVGASGAEQRTTDISSIVQEIVNRSGWAPSNAMAFVISGTGTRTAESFEGDPAAAPLLHIEWLPPGPGNQPPSLDLDGTAGGTGHTAIFTENGAAVAVAGAAAIADADDTVLQSAMIVLTNPQAGDLLSVIGGLPGGVVVEPGSTASSILLTGSASLADYEAALQ